MTPILSIFKRVRPGHPAAPPCDIAARCAAAVKQQIRSRTLTMGAAELRGYVRVLVLPAVRAEIQHLAADGRLPANPGNDFVASMLERTVQLVVRDLDAPPVIAIPAAHVQLRSAA